VSDFLISTIGSFAGLRVSRGYGRNGDLNVRVELRYETELRWAANELNGLIVKNEPIRAEVDQVGIRKKMEREMAYERLQEKLATPTIQQHQVVGLPNGGGGVTGAYGGNPYDPPQTNNYSTYDPNYPSTMPPPPVPNGAAPPVNGGSTPLGGRSRPAPPPPPPPAKRSKTEGGLPDGSIRPASLAVPEEAEPNPFSPRWMMGGK
jgi:hypothetical protein